MKVLEKERGVRPCRIAYLWAEGAREEKPPMISLKPTFANSIGDVG